MPSPLVETNNPGAVLRLHKDEAAVLEPYVLDLVNRTIDTYSKRYGFTLKQPVIVELYPDHDDFAVRIAGLPGIGLLGVTFGYLVAMEQFQGPVFGIWSTRFATTRSHAERGSGQDG